MFAEKCFQMKLKSPYFEEMKEGRKRVEMRLFDEKRRALLVGDVILFEHDQDPKRGLAVRVTALCRYACFEDLISSFSPDVLGFPHASRAQIKALMDEIYPLEEQRRWGVLAIGVEVIE